MGDWPWKRIALFLFVCNLAVCATLFHVLFRRLPKETREAFRIGVERGASLAATTDTYSTVNMEGYYLHLWPRGHTLAWRISPDPTVGGGPWMRFSSWECIVDDESIDRIIKEQKND